jgi:hypothetical protein
MSRIRYYGRPPRFNLVVVAVFVVGGLVVGWMLEAGTGGLVAGVALGVLCGAVAGSRQR